MNVKYKIKEEVFVNGKIRNFAAEQLYEEFEKCLGINCFNDPSNNANPKEKYRIETYGYYENILYYQISCLDKTPLGFVRIKKGWVTEDQISKNEFDAKNEQHNDIDITFINGNTIKSINSTDNKRPSYAQVIFPQNQNPEQRIEYLQKLINKSLDENNKDDFEKYSKEYAYLKSEFMI